MKSHPCVCIGQTLGDDEATNNFILIFDSRMASTAYKRLMQEYKGNSIGTCRVEKTVRGFTFQFHFISVLFIRAHQESS